jgi:glycogen synthase
VNLLEALERSLSLFRRPEELRRMQVEAVLRIRAKHTWDKVMKAYLKLYEKARLLRLRRGTKG